VGHRLSGCLSLPRCRGFKFGQHFSGSLFCGAAEFLKTFIKDGDLVLIKASRGIGLDKIVTQLEGAH